MEKNTRKKVMLGFLAFGGAVIFFFGIFFVGKKQNLFSKTFNLSVIFNDVNGVKKGNYVHFSGLRAGIVRNISFINDSMIKVDLNIDKALQPLIKKDSKVYIATEGLVGDKVIEIKPVHKSIVPVKDNDTLMAINPFDTHEIIEKLLSTNTNASIISDNLAKLSDQVNKPHKGLISTLSNDSMVAKNFVEIIHSLQTTGKQIATLSAHLEKIIDNVDLDKGALGAMISDTALKENLSSTLKNLNTMSEHSIKVVENINNSMQSSTNNNAIGVLMKDSVFAKNLKEGVENFKKSTSKLDENMEALKHNVFFRRYFRKSKNKKSPVL